MNTMNYQIVLKKEIWVIVMILKIYFLMDMIIVRCQKIRKSRLKKNRMINLFDFIIKSAVDLCDMQPVEVDEEEVREGEEIKILTSNKLLTRLPILLAHKKAGNS